MKPFEEQLLNHLLEAGYAEERCRAARRRRRWWRRVGMPAIALVVLGAIIVVSTGARSRVDVVAEARAALAPQGYIVHMTVTSTMSDGSSSPIPPRTFEQWYAHNPLRWRLSTSLNEVAEEADYAGGVARSYQPSSNKLVVTSGLNDDSPLAQPPALLGDRREFADLDDVLERGTLRDVGLVTVGARTVRRLSGQRTAAGGSRRYAYTYDVEPKSFAPIAATVVITSTGVADSTDDTITYEARVTSYERLRLTSDTAHILELTRIVQQASRGDAPSPRRV